MTCSIGEAYIFKNEHGVADNEEDGAVEGKRVEAEFCDYLGLKDNHPIVWSSGDPTVMVEPNSERGKPDDEGPSSKPIGITRNLRGTTMFACCTCGYRCKTKQSLSVHLSTHVGETPFPCDRCESRFGRLDDLKSHKKIHIGEKHFSCYVCGSRFNQSCNLKTHMRIHTGEKPFACKVCQCRFSQSCHLKTHMRIHTGEKPFICTICQLRFSHQISLQRHNKKVHSNTSQGHTV